MKKVLCSVLSLPLLLSIGAVASEAGLAYPNLAGSKYCSLRAMGIDYDTALEEAIREGWDDDYIDTRVTHEGKRYGQSTLDMYDYVKVMCPQFIEY